MPYTGNPATNLIDQVRINVGDIYCDIEMLDDPTYSYFLTKYNQNVNRSSIDAARSILFTLARYTREKAGQIEVYGSDWIKNYQKVLTEMVMNPNLTLSIAIPYAGGISKMDMWANDNNQDAMRPELYQGMTRGIHAYNKIKLLDDPAFSDGNNFWGSLLLTNDPFEV